MKGKFKGKKGVKGHNQCKRKQRNLRRFRNLNRNPKYCAYPIKELDYTREVRFPLPP